MTSFTPIVLEGANLGQRHRHFNSLVTEARQHNASLSTPPPHAPLDRLFAIELASQRCHLDSTLQTLKDEDMLYVNRALKSTWLLDPEFRHIINPHYLEQHLYPEMVTTAVNKMKHWIHLNLRDTKRCEEFFDYYSKKESDLAMKFLLHCSSDYILSKVTDFLERLTPHYLKRLCEKSPEVAKIFFGSCENNKTLLSTYLSNERHYYNNLRCILKSNSDVFLDITEKYFNADEFKTFSPEATKYVMRHCKIRFNRKPELYTACLLDMNTLAKCLSRDEVKNIVLKLAKAEYLSGWFSYKNVEPLIKTLPAEERVAFKNKVFVDKDIGAKVEGWPYEPPSRPQEDASGINIFQEKEHNPHEYENLDNLFKKRLMKKRCCKKKCDYTITSHHKSTLDLLFDRYRFASFEMTLFELRKKMTVEDQQNRQNMMLVLVSKTGGRPESVEELLKLLMERHENEPVNLRATVVRSLVKRSSSWRLPQETWELMMQFGRDMGLDGKPTAVTCVEGLHAVVLRNMLLDRVCDTAVWDAFLGVFTTFLEYPIASAERCVIMAKLPALLQSDAETNPSQAIERLGQLLDMLDAYKIPTDKYPGVIALISAIVRRDSNAESLLRRLFDSRISRKELYKENFVIIQTDASYFNALKHDAAILESGKEFEYLIESDNLQHKRFLRALTLYFGEENGLAEKYLSVLEKYADVSPSKQLASPLALLGGQKLISLLQKLDESNKDIAKKQLSAALRANIHLARPLLDINALKWEYIGAKAVCNRVLRCSDVNVESFIAKLLTWNHTYRLALVLSMRIGKEYDVLTTLVERRHHLALKTILWHTRHGNKLDYRIWDIIIHLIRKLDTSKLNNRLRKALDRAHVVPSEKKSEYCATLFEVLKKISKNAAMPMLCHLEYILPEVNERFIDNVFNDFIDNEFTEENVTEDAPDFNKRASLYVRIIAKYILLAKSEGLQKYRIKIIGEPFFDRLETLWNRTENILQFIIEFMFTIKYTKVFLDTDYVSCLPVFEFVITRMHNFLPVELHFDKYIKLHLTMLYFKSIRQSVRNNPEILSNLSSNLHAAVESVGVIFGKYIAHEITELKTKYFESVVEFYKDDLVEYVNDYFEYDITRGLFTGYIINGILKSHSDTHLLAESIYDQEDCTIPKVLNEKILQVLKESKNEEVKFFVYANFAWQ